MELPTLSRQATLLVLPTCTSLHPDMALVSYRGFNKLQELIKWSLGINSPFSSSHLPVDDESGLEVTNLYKVVSPTPSNLETPKGQTPRFPCLS